MFTIYLLNHFRILICDTQIFKSCYLFNNTVVYHNCYPLYVVTPHCHWFCFCTRYGHFIFSCLRFKWCANVCKSSSDVAIKIFNPIKTWWQIQKFMSLSSPTPSTTPGTQFPSLKPLEQAVPWSLCQPTTKTAIFIFQSAKCLAGHHIYTGSEVHAVLRVKAAGAWCWPMLSVSAAGSLSTCMYLQGPHNHHSAHGEYLMNASFRLHHCPRLTTLYKLMMGSDGVGGSPLDSNNSCWPNSLKYS